MIRLLACYWRWRYGTVSLVSGGSWVRPEVTMLWVTSTGLPVLLSGDPGAVAVYAPTVRRLAESEDWWARAAGVAGVVEFPGSRLSGGFRVAVGEAVMDPDCCEVLVVEAGRTRP